MLKPARSFAQPLPTPGSSVERPMLRSTARLVRDGAISIAYPDDCRICGDSIQSWGDGVACAACWENPSITDLFTNRALCRKCGAPTGRLAGSGECKVCEDLPVAAARACGAYKGAVEASILFLKSHPHIHTRLYNLMRSAFDDNEAALASDLIVPVPLHKSRLRERGFNQADVVARALERISGLSADFHCFERVKQTSRHRIGMDARERAKSVLGAFRVVRPDIVGGRSVLICDDVMTSGSTIAEAARSLIKSGATRVTAFTIARAIIRPAG